MQFQVERLRFAGSADVLSALSTQREMIFRREFNEDSHGAPVGALRTRTSALPAESCALIETASVPAGNTPQVSPEMAAAYRALAADPRYAHFINIPDRIICCLNYFGIPGDREPIRRCLHSYYLFIGVVDDAIDNGEMITGVRVLDHLASSMSHTAASDEESTVWLVTEVLKHHIPKACRSLICEKMHELYEQALNERAATAVKAYIDFRIAVGTLTAELSYLLIRQHLESESDVLCRLMKQIGAVGCLVDSLIDLKSDYALGLLWFTPTPADYLKLMRRTLRLGLRITMSHPLLWRLFLPAIFDNIRDRLPRSQLRFEDNTLASNGKDQAPSVA
jgi:hypothetical protein